MAPKSTTNKWIRDGRRLQRMSTMLDENVLEDDEVLLLKTDATNAIEKLIVQHKIPIKPTFRNKLLKLSLQEKSRILSLPLEILIEIINHVSVKDVENLGRSCKMFNTLFTKTFITRVVLPLSEENMEKLGGKNGRYILSLTSSVNIRLWDDRNFERILRNMNLKYLKEIKFVGNNYSIEYGGGLISGYKSIMRNIFLTKKYVRKMDISIDSSTEYYHLMMKLKEMPYLEELCLRSSGLRSQFNETMPQEKTLNQVLNDMLSGLKIKILELKGFTMPWGDYSGKFGLSIISNSIEVLRLQYSKNFELSSIETEQLKEMQITSDYYYFCLYHAQSIEHGSFVYKKNDPPGRLARMLARGCPELDSYNGLDLNILREESEDGDWLAVLGAHKGEGIDSDYSTCCHQCEYHSKETERRRERDERDETEDEEIESSDSSISISDSEPDDFGESDEENEEI